MKKQAGGPISAAVRQQLETEINDMGSADRARALKMLGRAPAVVKKTTTVVAPAPKKGGKVAVSSVDWAPGMPRENIVQRRQFTVTSGPGQGKKEAMSRGTKIIGDTLYPSGSYKLTPEDMKDLNKDTGIDPYQKDRIARIKSGASTSPDAYKKGGMTDIKQDKAMVKKAVHKHEAAMHPGKPMTKLRKGGMPC
jgi:hypothetical protein